MSSVRSDEFMGGIMTKFQFICCVLIFSIGGFGDVAEAKNARRPLCGRTTKAASSPDYMSTPELIKYYGYESEAHNVTTADGYILTLFRIPKGKDGTPGKEPIVVQHGLFCSSSDWLILDANNNLPLLLVDQGYDVWLGNCRGNNYSQGHVNLSADSLAYWNFSFAEMGKYDIPAVFEYVLKTTGQEKLSYVGHSMGTTMFFIAMSEHPELNSKVRKMVAMAPSAYLSHTISPLGVLLPQIPSPAIVNLLDLLSEGRIIPDKVNDYMKIFAPIVCAGFAGSEVCNNIFFLIVGFNPAQYPPGRASMITGHTPSDASAKTLVHFLQYMNRAVITQLLEGILDPLLPIIPEPPAFQTYDYGKNGNVAEYGTADAPLYQLNATTVPMLVLYGANDWLVQPVDAKRTISELRNAQGVQVNDTSYNHLDFTYANNAKAKAFDATLDFLAAI